MSEIRFQASDGTTKNAGEDNPLPVTGTISGGAIGALDDTKETDPDAASASTNALLRGILETLQTIATNTTPA